MGARLGRRPAVAPGARPSGSCAWSPARAKPFFHQLVDLVGPERARQIREKTTSDTLSFSPAYDCQTPRPRPNR